MNPDRAPEVVIESATAATTTVSLRFAADAASAVSVVPTLAPKRRDGDNRRIVEALGRGKVRICGPKGRHIDKRRARNKRRRERSRGR